MSKEITVEQAQVLLNVVGAVQLRFLLPVESHGADLINGRRGTIRKVLRTRAVVLFAGSPRRWRVPLRSLKLADNAPIGQLGGRPSKSRCA